MIATLQRLFARLRALFTKTRLDTDFDMELAQHLEAATADNIRAGMTPAEARRQARMALGGLDVTRELHRDTRSLPWLEQLARDVRHAWRGLRRSPGFTAVVVLTLALGLTVNLVLFNITNDLFFRPLPAAAPHELVVIAQASPAIDYQIPVSYADAEDFRQMVESDGTQVPDMARVYAGIMAYQEIAVHMSRAGESSERTWVHAVTDNYFSVLGVQPHLGRFLLPAEVRAPGTEPVVVLAHETWRNRFGADPSVVGRTANFNGRPYTVVGVAPAGFHGASWGTALAGFVPATMLTQLRENGQYYALKRGNTAVFLVGRLKPGVSLTQARAAVDVAFGRVMQANPGYYPREARAVVMRERDSRPSPYIAHKTPRIVAALSALALLVLVIAVANAANLLYARAASRERELAIRAAVGASRTQIIRSLLAESILLALAAGVLGSVASLALTPALLGILPTSGNTAPGADTGTDWRPFLAAGMASLVVGVVAGLMPALKASGVAPLAFIKETSSPTGSRRHPWRSLLVVGQVAVSCVVLVGASLTLRSMVLLLRTDFGFQVQNVMVASFDLGRQNYDPVRGREFQARLLEKVRALPGVEAASLVTAAPLDSGINQIGGITAADAPAPAGNLPHSVAYVLGEHTCLSTLGLRIEAGRDFSVRDGFGSPRVVLINRALAEHIWRGQDPIGRQISVQGNKAEVIGVVGRSRYYNIADDSRPLLFDSLAQNYRGAVTLVVRHAGPVEPLTAAIPAIVRELDPDLPLYGLRSLLEQIMASASGLMPYRVGAILASVQGTIALLLAGAGVFGLIAFAVARRTREIGIRMALGASWLDVVRAVTRESIVLTTAGLVIGLAVSFALSRTLSGLLYGAGTLDTVVFGGVGLLVLMTAALACWLPARRAASVDPLVTLRAE